MTYLNQVFISYSRKDHEKILKINRVLRSKGIRTWFDQKDILPGIDWNKKTQQAIRESRFFMMCLSSNSIMSSGYVKREFEEALVQLRLRPLDEVYLIPCLLEPIELPKLSIGFISLSDYQFFSLNRPDSLDRLTDYLIELKDANTESGLQEPLSEMLNELVQGRLDKAMSKITNLINTANLDAIEDLMLLSSRYYDIQRQHDLGQTTFEQFTTYKNRLSTVLLKMLKTMLHSKV